MRYVDNQNVGQLLDAAWHQRATDALKLAVEEQDEAERKKKVSGKAAVWQEAGAKLKALSNGCCWYCNVRQVRSDMPVDHFRPKGRVAEECTETQDPGTGKVVKQWTHPGYWWLAFDWRNFRISCTFCNSKRIDCDGGSEGGKQDHFPLKDGSLRARSQNDDHGLEQVALLDPCRVEDPSLLSFRQDGYPVPTHDEVLDPWSNERARCSIRHYHLDHGDLVRDRKDLWLRVDNLVDAGNRAAAANQPLDAVKSELLGLLKATSSLARVARLAVRGRRDTDWVQEWLDIVEPTL